MSAQKPSAKPLRLRQAAWQDLQQLFHAGTSTGVLRDAVQLALAHISHQSGIGQPQPALGLPGLRLHRVHGQALGLWYLERADRVEVLRVLAFQRLSHALKPSI